MANELQTTAPANTAIQQQPERLSVEVQEAVLLNGDLMKMTKPQRVEYYLMACRVLKLNPLSKPFDYMVFQGKSVLYPNKSCAEQLRANNHLSVKTSAQIQDDLYIVTAEGALPDGRSDSALGVVAWNKTMGPEAKANAMMKAETKAKRRLALSMLGLGFSMDKPQGAQIADFNLETGEPMLPAAVQPEEREPNDEEKAIARQLMELMATKNADGTDRFTAQRKAAFETWLTEHASDVEALKGALEGIQKELEA